MDKALIAMIAGLFVAGAQAQNPAGVSDEQGNATNSIPQQRAEAWKASRPAGQVVLPMGDTIYSIEATGVANDRSALVGESSKAVRDQKYPNRPKTTQGGTPDMPGAK